MTAGWPSLAILRPLGAPATRSRNGPSQRSLPQVGDGVGDSKVVRGQRRCSRSDARHHAVRGWKSTAIERMVKRVSPLVAKVGAAQRTRIAVAAIGVVLGALAWASVAQATTSVFGTTGSNPWSMAMDSNGTLYVPNSATNDVSRITAAGASTVSWATVQADPYGIAVAADGTVYVANRVGCSVSKITAGGAVTANWASTGAGTYPRAVAVDAAGNVYTANTDTGTVTRITSAGAVTAGWASTGASSSSPRAIAVDANGNVYTANNGADTVTKITAAGVATPNWASTGVNSAPNGIAIDSAGNVYVTLYNTAKVAKITPDATVNATWGSTGSGPYGITVAADGNVYVANSGANTVSRITAAGASTVAWASTGAGTMPRGIVADATGNVFTANYGTGTVTRVAPDPAAAPTALTATAADASVSVAFTAGSDNGWAITNYAYSTDNGATWTARSPASTASPIAITGLANGTEYAIKLRAINSGGSGTASSAVTATPLAAPGAPAGLAATAGDRSISIAFAAGADNGAAIANYAYSLDDGATWTTRSPASTASPIAITGLANGTAYSVRLRAINSVGSGAASDAVSVTPVAAPDAPTGLVATAFATDAEIRIAFSAGADNGWPITNYAYSLDDGATWTARSPASAASPITIGGLTNGTVYRIRLRAINRVGGGTPSNAATVALPPAPLKAVTLSATTVTTDEPVIATFAAAPGTTYTISASPSTTRLAPRAAARVSGTCSVTTTGKAKQRTATCRIRLTRAGTWAIAITPVRHGVKGAPTVKRVTVRASPSRSAGSAEPVTG